METLRIFIGYDAKESIAYHVLAHSIIARATMPVSITPLARHQINNMYTRPRGPLESTDFSMTRFLVPALSNYEGYSIFMDCDMLCQVDIADIWMELARHFNADGTVNKAVLCCQHDYTPGSGVKFLNQVQTAYPRKNWSSFMVLNNNLCRALTPEYVNTASGLDLHRFNWTTDDKIGSLPLTWNHLVGDYVPNPNAKILHYTLGGPWFEGSRNCDHADLWQAELQRMLGK